MIAPDDETVRIGFPVGISSVADPIPINQSPPAEALCRVVSGLLDDGPCFVAFSGGCDSSLILAVATRACRACGHPDPVPVTYRFAQAPEADERQYQELVVRRLGLRHWIVIDVDEDSELLGGPVTDALRTFGLVWPPALLAHVPALQQLEHGLFLTGEGGDELLGWRRVTPVADVARSIRHLRNPSRSYVGYAFESLAPRPGREALIRRRLDRDGQARWLVPDVREDVLRRVAAQAAAEPLGARAYFRYNLARPAVRIGHQNARTIHAHFGLRWEAPLYDPTFLGALSEVIWYDYRGRTQILRRHFAELLPSEIIERRTKSTFNGAYFGSSTQAFARRWTGEGLPDGVDGAWLQHHWSTADSIHTGTSTLLHRVWLATEGASDARASADPQPSAPHPDQGIL